MLRVSIGINKCFSRDNMLTGFCGDATRPYAIFKRKKMRILPVSDLIRDQ